MIIRTATTGDGDGVLRVYRSAFPDGENRLVARLALDLLAERTTPETISLVAEDDGVILGHIAFSPVLIAGAADVQGHILAPLAVQPDCQRRGIGSGLIEYGRQRLSAQGVNILFVYGDPNYYGRFGFRADAADPYLTPYPLQYPFGWQAVVLNSFDSPAATSAITCVGPLCNPELW